MLKTSKKINIKLTLINTLKKAEGSLIFRNLYLIKNNRSIDVLNNGRLSCAVFASSILKMFDLIKQRHATVSGTVEDLLKSGWQLTAQPQVGCVLVWENKIEKNRKHKHVGFYLGKNLAISNSSKLKYPAIHHWTYGEKNNLPNRKIEKILIHPSLHSSAEKTSTKNNKTKPAK